MQAPVNPPNQASDAQDAKPKSPGIALWALWLAIALVIRLYPALPRLLEGKPPPFPDAEGLSHLRRIREILRRFPEVQTFDPYLSFPKGSLIPGEPGFDLLLSYVIRFTTGFLGGDVSTIPSTETILWVGLLAAPLIGVMILPIYGLIAQEIGPRGGLYYLLPALALTGAMVTPSTFGRVSSAVLEPLLFALPLLPLLIASREGSGAQGTSNKISLSAAGGLLLGGSFFFWRGMTLSATVIAIWLGKRALSKQREGRLSGFDLWGGALTMGVAAAVAAPLCISHPMGRAGQVTAETLSWLQPLYLFSLGAGLGLMSLLLRYVGGIMEATALSPAPLPAMEDDLGGKLRRVLGSLLALGAGLAPLGLLTIVSPSMRSVLPEAPFPWMAPAPAIPIQEVYGWPLFQAPDGAWALLNPLAAFGLTLVFWPLALLRLKQAQLKVPVLIVSMALLLGLAGVMDQRYIPLLGPTYALVLAFGLHGSEPRGGVSIWRGLIALLLFVPALPGVTQAWGASQPNPQLKDAMTWLQKESPNPGAFALGEGQSAPSFGVLAPPELGYHIVEVGRRPAICVPGEGESLNESCRQGLQSLISGGVEASMSDLRARYLVLGDDLSALNSIASLSKGRGSKVLTLGPGDFLAKSDGRLEAPGSPMTGLRMVFEGEEGEDRRYKIFERVEGARIIGRWRPNHRIQLQLPIVTNQGRSFLWTSEVRVDPQGRYEMRVPYANLDRRQGWTWAGGPAELRAFGPGGEEIHTSLDIDPESVRLGWTIRGDIQP